MATQFHSIKIEPDTKPKPKPEPEPITNPENEDDDVTLLDGNPNPPEIHVITIEDDDDDDDENDVVLPSRKPKRDDPKCDPNPMARPVLCSLCSESKPRYKSFSVRACLHSFCCECIEAYVSSNLGSGITRFGCPDPNCFGTLDPEYCKDIISPGTYQKWGKMLCESVFEDLQKVYCPYSDCSELMVDEGGERVTMAECWGCHRLFCASCKATWHEGVSCEDYQRLRT